MKYAWRDDFDWLEHAACRGAPPGIFYGEALPLDGEPNPVGIAAARAVCALCSVRYECADHALHEEQALAVDSVERDGIRGGLTPAQRWSIEKRGGLKGADPLDIIEGRQGSRTVPPIPDSGDRWSRHHTTLAHKVLRWLTSSAGVEDAGRLPSQAAICRAIPCKQGPLRVVLDALVADGTLDVVSTGNVRYYVRRPQHLSNGDP